MYHTKYGHDIVTIYLYIYVYFYCGLLFDLENSQLTGKPHSSTTDLIIMKIVYMCVWDAKLR